METSYQTSDKRSAQGNERRSLRRQNKIANGWKRTGIFIGWRRQSVQRETRVSQSLEPLTDKNWAKTKDWTYIPLLTLKT